MPSSPPPDPAAPDVLAALERELQELRGARAEWERDRAAIVLERGAIDAERMTWVQEREEHRRVAARLEDVSAHAERRAELLEEERAAYAKARDELTADVERLKQVVAAQERALRWSPRHWVGLLAHRSEAMRRLRSGRGGD